MLAVLVKDEPFSGHCCQSRELCDIIYFNNCASSLQFSYDLIMHTVVVLLVKKFLAYDSVFSVLLTLAQV